MDMELLMELCRIPGLSGDETKVRDFVLDYCRRHQASWTKQPEIWVGDGFKDNLVLIFGTPETAWYAHMDTVGFMARYDNYLVPVGGPDGSTGDFLVYEENGKWEETRLIDEEDAILVDAQEKMSPGTQLYYKPHFEEDENFIRSPYLDDRFGVWSLLQYAPKANNIALVFSTYEEHGGGGAGLIARLLFEKYQIRTALIADVTWSTDGVSPGKGPVVSIRDSRIPRRRFVECICSLLEKKSVPFQREVEAVGGSDGREIQHIPYPIDWCFFGPPSENPHSSLESIHKEDIPVFLGMISVLSENLPKSWKAAENKL